jgi:small subunit ribosomal protein S1
VEGLIHISEMSWTKKTLHPSKLLQVDQTVEVLVLNVDPLQRRIALGLKQVIPNPWLALKDKYPMGTVIKGPVRNVTDFGVFVEVEEGIDGLVHVSDLHWTKKVKHPAELYKKGDVVEAKVLGVDVQNQRLSLGIKQLSTDPWQVTAERYPVGSKVKGTVTSVPDFGVFVRLEEGVEGLVHVSQLSLERVDKPSSLYKVGDSIETEVIHIDAQQRKIGLSVRALKKTEERQEMESYLKKERDASKFSFETILNEELRLDREEGSESPEKRKGGNP